MWQGIKEGDLYRIIEIEGKRFEIYYGYESESERQHGWEPTPLYPNFTEQPQYTKEGVPFAVAYSEVCAHYAPVQREAEDEWCAGCAHFDKREDVIGLCRCPKNLVRKNE